MGMTGWDSVATFHYPKRTAMQSPALHTALIHSNAEDLERRARRACAHEGIGDAGQVIRASGFVSRVIQRLAGRPAGEAALA